VKRKQIISGFVVLALLILITALTFFSREITCMIGGGMWSYLPSGCVDSCTYGETGTGERVCTAVMTWGCDCGPEKCWNGKSCESNKYSNDSGYCEKDVDCVID